MRDKGVQAAGGRKNKDKGSTRGAAWRITEKQDTKIWQSRKNQRVKVRQKRQRASSREQHREERRQRELEGPEAAGRAQENHEKRRGMRRRSRENRVTKRGTA
ncbi:hypothetical protein MWG46_00195 [Escherichia coli]|nr:hypothetical protein [Escherichia coli]